jgi:hypothetical protein
VFLSHPQNIQWRYTLEHSRNYVETLRPIMNLLGVDIPPLEGQAQLRFLMTKKRTLEMMECVEEFVDCKVLKSVQQRTDKVNIARTAKVEEMEAVVVVVAAVAAAAVAVRKEVAKKAAAVAAVAVAVAVRIEVMKKVAAAVVAATKAVVAAAVKMKAGSQP